MLCIGLMSGTSADGIDLSLIDTDGENNIKFLYDFYHPYPKDLQKRILKICRNGSATFREIQLLSNEITIEHYNTIREVITAEVLKKVVVIGFHGQTVYHNSLEKLTMQIGNPSKLAFLSKTKVISDFRNMDIAAGGEGAPLVPIFHKLIAGENTVVNIGGIANITTSKYFYDVGPGNILSDELSNLFFNVPYDNSGNFASKGTIDKNLANKMINDYLQSSPPKSVDRYHYVQFLQILKELKPYDAIATACYIVAKMIANNVPDLQEEVLLCGGGTQNLFLLSIIKSFLPNAKTLSEAKGYSDKFIESQAFAYIAARSYLRLPYTINNPTSGGGIYG